MTIGERLKEIRESLGISQVEFAEKINVSKQTLYKYENNIITNIPSDKIEAAASMANVSPAYIMGWIDHCDNIQVNNVFKIEKRKFPLLGNIACGEPIFAEEENDSYIMAGTDIDADFCLKAKGDSMIGARIQDGDIVFIKKQSIVKNGEIAAVLIEDEATLKRIQYDIENNEISLFAENPRYPTKHYKGEQLNQIRILGKAVAFQSDIR